MRAALFAIVAVGCSCPEIRCAPLLQLSYVQDWPASTTWELRLTVGEQSFPCTITVPSTGIPTDADVVCNDGVLRTTYLVDTGGNGIPGVVSVEFVLPDFIEEGRLTVTQDGQAVTGFTDRRLGWSWQDFTPLGDCPDCDVATLQVALDAG
jgi:hypothetical protein